MKKLLSLVLTISVIISAQTWILPASAANTIQDQINAVLAVYPSGSYFTVASKTAGCTSSNHDIADGNWCSGCYLPSIPARGGLPSGAAVGYGADTCCGFASYVFYCIFNHNHTVNTTVTHANPVFGDLVNTGNHWFIYLSEDSTNYYVYDANGYNYNRKNKVAYNNYYPKSAVSYLTVYHANNYKSFVSHTHSYERGYEAAHPHRVYMKCSCGDYYYTGETTSVSNCEICYPHVHNYSTYVYYWDVHPHYKCYQCSCGDVKENRNETVYVASCELCNSNIPGKPTLSVTATKETNLTGFTWSGTKSTDSYDLRICRSSDDESILTAWGITATNYSCALPAGSYYATLCSVHGVLGNPDFAYTGSDRVDFAVLARDFDYVPVGTAVVDDRIFAVFDQEVSFAEAQAAAKNMGGALASIHNKAEHDAVAALVPHGTWCWLGATDLETEGIWKWLDGTEWDYTAWDAGEPSNSTGWWGDEDYLSIRYNYVWNDMYSAYTSPCGFVVAFDCNEIAAARISKAEYGNSNYLLFEKGLPWEVAQAYCETLGGHLAAITSAAENDTINALARKVPRHCWIGATDKVTEGSFRWVTGENFSYTSWENGEPNNYGVGEDYLILLPTSVTGFWNDNKNDYSSQFSFICEFEKTVTPDAPNAPTIGLTGATQFTVVKQEGYQYSLDGVNWQDSNLFTGLLPDFEYCVYQRKAADRTAFASPASVYTTVQTNGNDPFSGTLSAYHLVWVQRKLLTQPQNMATDINGDNIADIRDLVHLKKLLAEAE